ncbi:MFS transporter [Niallia sp. NCCP-28]|uniref:MFS transporter n=1 Tax=Niallia sp. NCCP-28 TaxID=2934712 RepID=UPI0020807356|nr:MFS transporter [Niallia sp. NCCP-28]GKU83447.1 MFS transporter [Niallia sp. NCCP-28]
MKKTNVVHGVSTAGVNRMNKQKTHSILLLVSVCAGAFLSHFSAGFVNIALTDISLYFSSSLSLTQWIVNGYLLSIMLFLPFMGKVADQYGKKKIHNLGYLIFAVGAGASALSTSIQLLIIGRVVQGFGAAMLQAVNMAIVTDAYPEKHRGRALGIISTSVGFGALLGPSVGGLLIEAFSWHILFWIIVPFSLSAFVLAQKYIPLDKQFYKSSFDYIGSMLFAVSIVTFVYVLNSIGEGAATPVLFAILIISVIVFWGFMHRSRRVDYPFIDPGIFSSLMVRSGGVILTISYAATFAAMVSLPFYLRGVLHYSAEYSGLLLMCYPLFLALFGPISGSLSDRFGSIKIVFIGLFCLSISMFTLSLLSQNTTLPILIVLFCFLGFSMGILTSPNYSIMMFYVPLQYLGMMSSTIALLRNIGMILGTAVSITFMNSWLDHSLEGWMKNPKEGSAEVMTGFHYLFLLLGALTVLAGVYFFRCMWKSAESERKKDDLV